MTRRRADAPRKGDLRREAVLDAAERLLAEVGFDAMTIADVAGAAGISRGALYFYFGSKHEIVTGLFGRCVTELQAKSTAALENAASGSEAVTIAMERTEALWREHGAVMRTAIDLSASIDDLDRMWTETAEHFTEAIRATLEAMGLQAGPGIGDSSAVAEALCWMIERNFYQASRVSGEELAQASQTCAEIWRRAARVD